MGQPFPKDPYLSKLAEIKEGLYKINSVLTPIDTMQRQDTPRHMTLVNSINNMGTQAARFSQGQNGNTFIPDGKQSPILSQKQGTWKWIVNPETKVSKQDNSEPGNSLLPQKRGQEVWSNDGLPSKKHMVAIDEEVSPSMLVEVVEQPRQSQ